MPANKYLLIPKTVVRRNPPATLVPGDERYFQHEYERVFPDVFAWKFNHVTVTAEGIIFNGLKIYDQNIIDPTHRKDFNLRYLLSKYLKYHKLKLEDNEKYLLAYNYWSNGYFHWMCDVLPRLVALGDEIKSLTLLIPESFQHPFFRETLRMFPLKNIYVIPTGCIVQVPHLTVPDLVTSTGNYNPEIMMALKNKLDPHPSDMIPQRRIYISRAKATRRKIINEEQVLEVLKQYDFEIFYFEDHPVNEQIDIASNAKILVSLHGAALTNILFMRKPASVLEFRKNDDDKNNCYFSLASIAGIDYFYQRCNSIHYSDNANTFDIQVDPVELKENLERIIYK